MIGCARCTEDDHCACTHSACCTCGSTDHGACASHPAVDPDIVHHEDWCTGCRLVMSAAASDWHTNLTPETTS